VKVGAFSRFRHYTNLHRCESRLRQVLTDFSFSTMGEVLGARGLLSQSGAGQSSAAPSSVVA
jgi:hypothetical protein